MSEIIAWSLNSAIREFERIFKYTTADYQDIKVEIIDIQKTYNHNEFVIIFQNNVKITTEMFVKLHIYGYEIAHLSILNNNLRMVVKKERIEE